MQEEEETAATPADETVANPAPSRFGDRLRQRAARNVPTGANAGTPTRAAAAPKEIVDGLDNRERNIGIAAVLLALTWAILGYFVDKHSTVKATHDSADFGLISNVLFALIITLGVAMKRRALLGFGALFFGLEQTFSFRDGTIGIPFLAFGGWLIYRANRKQREIRDANGGRPPARTSRASAGSAARKPANPKASKRYTPPRRSASSGRR